METRVYPIVLSKDGNGYLVNIPDFEIDTEGNDLADAIFMAYSYGFLMLWLGSLFSCVKILKALKKSSSKASRISTKIENWSFFLSDCSGKL